MRWLLLCVLVACDEPAESVDCAESGLALQCPPGSQPVVGAAATAECAAGAEVRGSEGEVTGRCYAEQQCQVLCRFDDPCPCGVASITAEGVFCAVCEGACGDGVCAGGEDPSTCPQDCGPRCQADEARCNGVLRQVCSRQGRFENLACPAGEVCVEVGVGQVDCQSEGVVQVDAGPPGADAGVEAPWIAGGRARRGPGTWPGSGSAQGAAPAGTPRLRFEVSLTQGVTYLPEGLLAAAPGASADDVVVCGTAGCRRFPGWSSPLSAEDYCRVFSQCYPEYAEACASPLPAEAALSMALNYAFGYAGGLLYGPPVQRCVATVMADGVCPVDLRGLGCPGAGEGALAATGFAERWFFSPGGRFAAFLQRFPDRTELGWGALAGGEPQTLALGQSTLVAAAISDAGVLVAVLADGAGQVVAFVPPGAEPTFTPLDEGGVTQVAVSPSGGVAALGSPALVRFWNLSESLEIVRIRDAVWPLAFSPIEGIVAFHFAQGGAELWDVAAIEKQGDLPGTGTGFERALGFHPAGHVLTTASAGGIQHWEVATRTRIGQEAVDPRFLSGPFEVRWSGDGQSLVVQLPTRLLDPTLQPLYRHYGLQ